MNILILTLGSRGDVQPYVALGKGLKAAGHTVTVCASSSFEPLITSHGLDYGYMSDEFIKLVDSEAGREAMEHGRNPFALVKTMLSLLQESKRIFRTMLKETWETAQAARPDVVIYHPKSLGGSHIAEKLGVPAILATPVPVIVPTAEMVAVGMPALKLGCWYNLLSYKLIDKGYHTYDTEINAFRQDSLGLAPMPKSSSPLQTTDGRPIPVIHGYSEHVSPRPVDWPQSAHITGYWFLEEQPGWQPPARLVDFLAAEAPPVYIGFGSMAGRNPQRLAEIAIEALKKTGQRGILATGWGGLDVSSLPPTVLKIDQAPHSWLFPRVSAVVHHGGAGTTAAGLQAGRPTIITPFMVDQPYWGERVHALGAGSKPIPQNRLTAEKLAAAIREVTTNPAILHNAAILGEKIRAEDGIASAISIIERVVKST